MGISPATTSGSCRDFCPLSLQNGEDIKFTRQLIEALLQRGRYGNAPREPIDPPVMALLTWKPDTFDAGQPPGFPDCAHRCIDIPFEYLNQAERINPHAYNRLSLVPAVFRIL